MKISITQASVTQWKQRWETMSSERFRNDYAMAQLAGEIRAEFPEHDSGDLQFRTFVKKHLTECHSKTFLEKAKAYVKYSEAEWHRLGGWQGVSFLMALTTKQRGLVMNTLHGQGPFHYCTIRARAMKLGIVSKRKGRGNLTKSEERVAVLRMFIAKLYKERRDLPEVPADVRWALSPTLMTSIAQGIRA